MLTRRATIALLIATLPRAGFAEDAAARAEGAAGRLNEERAAITLMEVCRRILLRMRSDHPRPNV